MVVLPQTLSPAASPKSDKTDKTYSVGNHQFLRWIFGEPGDVRPVVVSFTGNPEKVKKSFWYGKPWTSGNPQRPSLPPTANNYLSLAVFMSNEAGQYRRQKTSFQALHAVMLDDLGGKIPQERLTLPPSWLLETSPGNYQAGYLLVEPINDPTSADRLMNAIVAAGLCDPGANGPTARLARLPKGVNGKHDPPFHCQLREWAQDRRYTVAELVDGLQLEIPPVGRPRRHRKHQQQAVPVDGDAVWIPRPADNAVLVALRHRGLYKAPLGEGKHDITCPWVQEHTNQVDNGTAYFEPDDLWPVGGFKCLHGHCANRHIRDLLRMLDIEVEAARMKPTIRVVAGEMHRVVDAAERELAQTLRHYQRGGLIVTVTTDPGTRETRVQEVSQPDLLRSLAGVATWERYDRRADDWVRVDPPARHVNVIYSSASYPHLPVLHGLARQPYLRADGSLMTTAGYDAASAMFGIFDAREFTVPGKPTRKQALAALQLLQELLAEFCFTSALDQAAALAAILTATIRPSLATAPMFHIRAHLAGAGKSYLCALFSAFATPQRGTPFTFPADDEETRKMLMAELLRAPAVIEFDNLTGDLAAHKSLCTALTSEFMSGRILGVSKTATVGTRTLFLSSGNNVGPIQDMTRRCLTIRLDPDCEHPVQRNFKRPDLVREVLRERGRYVSAALTIVRAWISAGKPKTPCKSLAGYGDWSDLCRQPLLWLGCADPTAAIFAAINDDPDREILGRLLHAWQAVFGKRPAMIREAAKEGVTEASQLELLEVLRDIAEERGAINRRKMGWWIKRHAGRIVDGRRFARASGNRSAEAWQVETVGESVLPVLPVSPPAEVKSVRATSPGSRATESAKQGQQLSLFGVRT